VGLRINELAAKPQPGQIWIKRVVAEMGGKDAIVVDSECDLDAAVQGVLVSAFGFQGQKCSACSRAIVDEKLYDEFLDKLKAKTEALSVGPSEDPGNYMGPVINEAATSKILNYIEIGKGEGRLICGGVRAKGEGYFIRPTIIADVGPGARIFQEEIFGPVLAVSKARDFDHAIELANATEYGLTGSVYTKNREKIKRASDEFHVGNLYFNRKCTGAMVASHPFGGFNMSGTDSKAGGPDYLLQELRTGREHQQQFGPAIQPGVTRIEQHLTDLFRHLGTAWFAGFDNLPAMRLQPCNDACLLCAFACTLTPFQGDKETLPQ